MSTAVFRVDSSNIIGTGHVMRCLTLAEKLKESEASIFFVIRKIEGHMEEYIKQSGFAVFLLPEINTAELREKTYSEWLSINWGIDASQTKKKLKELSKIDWLIVDHYSLSKQWELEIKPFVKKILVIDDLAEKQHECDVLLNQNIQDNLINRYDDLVPNRCLKLLGPKYSLLRPDFANELKKGSLRGDSKIWRILVSFGGTDPTNETMKSLKAIALLKTPNIYVDVLLSNLNKNKSQIKAFCLNHENMTIHQQVQNVAELMNNADLAIGAGGTTTWERCCLGLPSIVVSVASNQEQIAEKMATEGLILYLGKNNKVTSDEIKHSIQLLIQNSYLYKHLSYSSKKRVDGFGTARVHATLFPPTIHLRVVQKADKENIFIWRNSKQVRRFSFNAGKIKRKNHDRWFEGVLKDERVKLLIGEIEGEPIGVLKYDLNDDQAMVSIYVIPGKHGMGYGKQLLLKGDEWVHDNYPDITAIEAEVIAENIPSVKLFLTAGYERHHSVYLKRFHHGH